MLLLGGAIAHDFNNLLMLISGSAQLLKLRLRLRGEPSLAPLIDKISATVVRAALAELHDKLPSPLNMVVELHAGTGTVLSDSGQLQRRSQR